MLIIYYSRSENTTTIANQIQQATGSDIIRIEPVQAYPSDYRATTILARKELDKGYFPAIKNKIENLADYDTIFIGTPMWWGTLAMPLHTFLKEYDLAGKTLIPFVTHEGSGMGNVMRDLKKFQPNVTVFQGVAIYASDVKRAEHSVSQWLKSLNIATN